MHPCWLPPLPFLVSPKDRREEMTVHSNCKAWSSSPPTILGCRSYLLLRPLWLAQRESLSIPSVYMLEPLTSSHQNCFKYLLMGNNRWSLKATWKQRFWWWESSSRSLYFKAPLYTDPTHTIRKAWVCACFQVLIPRVGIKHEQIGRMTGSLSCFTWQSIFWHLPTSDQPGFTHFGARLFFRFALERTIRWTWWDSGAWPFCWRPGPLEKQKWVGKNKASGFHSPHNPSFWFMTPVSEVCCEGRVYQSVDFSCFWSPSIHKCICFILYYLLCTYASVSTLSVTEMGSVLGPLIHEA